MPHLDLFLRVQQPALDPCKQKSVSQILFGGHGIPRT
jgi:hypothetical protein